MSNLHEIGKCPKCGIKIADVRPVLNTPCPICGSPVKQGRLMASASISAGVEG